MDILTFISEIIKSLAWPISVTVLVALLRKPLVELIPLLKKLKYKELEIEFSQEVKALKVESDVALGPPDSKLSLQPPSKALMLLEISTRAAIMEAWIELETASVEVASSFWGQSPNLAFQNMPQLGDYLYECNVIDEKQLGIFKKLRELRNKAAHAEELQLSEQDAKSFVEMASNLTKHIKGMKPA